MASEKECVRSLQPHLQTALKDCDRDGWWVEVCFGWRLTDASEILLYRGDGSHLHNHPGYETDLLDHDTRPA